MQNFSHSVQKNIFKFGAE